MSQENILISFIGEKISRLCWCTNRDGSLSNDEFVTGGWDERGSNHVTLWRIPDDNMDATVASEPYVIAQSTVTEGSITEIRYTSSSNLIYSTSNGSLSIQEYDHHSNQFEPQQTWCRLHEYKTTNEPASCCCFDVNGQEIMTGGEDGRINVLHIDRKEPVHVIEQADSSNITGIQYLSSREMLSINSTGQLKIWDTRQLNNEKSAQKILTLSGNACPLLSVDKHPNQPHIVVTGHGDGVIGIWDTRQERAPVTLIDAHEAEVWQVKFHPMYPDNLFTCSEDGSCWFWEGSSMISGATMNATTTAGISTLSFHQNQTAVDDPASTSVWLYVDANKHKMETFSLIPFNTSPVNTFDVNTSRLICGTDNEAIIAVNNIPLR